MLATQVEGRIVNNTKEVKTMTRQYWCYASFQNDKDVQMCIDGNNNGDIRREG